jgi:flagellar biosynthesis protein FlhB
MGKNDDKTEKPTGTKLAEARKEGQVAKTPELATWLAVLVATYLVPLLMGRLGAAVERSFLSIGDVFEDPTPQRMVAALSVGMMTMFTALLPVMGGFMLLAVVADLSQIGGLKLATKAAKPTAKRLNPLKGFKRIFSVNSLYELGKNVAKVSIITIVAYPVAVDVIRQLVATGIVPVSQVAAIVGADALAMVRLIAMAGLFVAAADFGYQKRKTIKDLMMTKQEVRDEAKQSEGNPEMKGKIKGKMLAASRNRMLAAVKNADVVVVNPVHIAVALRYEPTRGAPRVVAMGKDTLAERIKEEAEKGSVPIVESIPLARALYAACDLDDEIPVQMYEAVARLLAFVHRIGKRRPLAGSVHQLPDSLVAV